MYTISYVVVQRNRETRTHGLLDDPTGLSHERLIPSHSTGLTRSAMLAAVADQLVRP